MNEILDRVKNIFESNNIKYDEEMLKKVVNYIQDVYKESKTKSGNLIIDHVIGVAQNVATLRIDDTSIYVALLHEVLKYDEYSEKIAKGLFSDEIVDMINTISKLSYFKHGNKVEPEILRKMFMAIAKDIRTVIIKLCDRLYNMQNISGFDENTTKTMAKECLEIYAPIAHRLGISKIKAELEDISFRILYPDEYHNIKNQIDEKKSEREDYIKDRIAEIVAVLNKDGIEATVYGRPKHFYSIYKKIKQKECTAEDLFDLLAIRIIVNSIKDCYNALGLVHDMYKPMPGRFKDYIAVPKTNMYQSLHTTVFGANGRPFEIQIRTWDMHKVAEEGIAAHFSYKEKSSKISEADKKLVWLRQTLELQQQIDDNTENLNKMKTELFGEEVFVFTPKGEIKSLPKGSTPIDFAYSIHQKIAEKMIGAKINGRMVPINTQLANTDIVEIITSTNSKGPSNDWLKSVKTTGAKSKITAFLKKQGRDINIQKGKEVFEKYLRKQKVSRDVLMYEKYINLLLKKYSLKTLDDLYENIGFGSISPLKVMNKLNEEYTKDTEDIKDIIIGHNQNKKKNSSKDLVIVDNINNCKVQFSKCCLPIPGDDIIGYITNSNGVSVHRVDCPNIEKIANDARKIKVSWIKSEKQSFSARIRVKANTRGTVLTDVIKKLNDLKVSIESMNTKTTIDRENIMEFTLNVPDTEMLQEVIKSIKKVDSVFEVKRLR